MAAETYYYFQPDTNLRADYGGAAIQDGGDSAELTKSGLCMRHICKQVSVPNTGTRYLCEFGLVGGTTEWLKVSNHLYSAISSYLSTAEAATVTTTKPTGYTVSSANIKYQPYVGKTNIFVRGDSISFGTSTTSGKPDDTCWAQAIESLAGTTITYDDVVEYRQGYTADYGYHNIAIPSSSWANTQDNGGLNPITYPWREDLAYAQRTQTLCLGASLFVYWLGTNDLAYDATLTGADCWTRASTRIAAFKTAHPSAKLIVATAIKRSSSTTLNNVLDAYNVLIRANYASAGADILCDFEANVSEVNIDTGDTTNLTVYAGDEVHLTTAGHTLLMPVAKAAIQAAMALP